ncbi:MAG: NAD-dependent deacylase [Bacteroidales bacterium]|nr:NAD-dependent deacylase [Porphyromonas sp.]MDD6933836.1 NAD-dependent deacylase [Bacteroidales bacterium]MDY3102057.1 NAD-dependent deacylase [Porphyromonas sp.]
MAKKNLVILSGAGMSAESGISTFRDSDGLWEQYPVQQVASIEGFRANPQLVLDFYTERRKNFVGCEPNDGHRGLVALEQDWDVTVITQNIDDLHERAGSRRVIHLHGEIMKNCSVDHPDITYPVDMEHPEIKVGDLAPDGSQLRPFIVWFGEAVPMIVPAAEAVRRADCFVVIGTSLNVYPAAGLLAYVPCTTPIYLVDPKPVESSYRKDIVYIRATASEGVARLTEILCSQGDE